MMRAILLLLCLAACGGETDSPSGADGDAGDASSDAPACAERVGAPNPYACPGYMAPLGFR